MYGLLRFTGFVFCICGVFADSHTTDPGATVSATQSSITNGSSTITSASPATNVTSGPEKVINATCSTGTVNYITHTLPQQCLRTGRVPSNSSSSETVNTTINATATSGDDLSTSSASSAVVKTLPDAVEPTYTAAVVGDPSQLTKAVTSSTTSSVATASSPLESHLQEPEPGSPLDTANFLSFEEWKKQNLAKAGQSPDDLGREQTIQSKRQRPDLSNAFDTLGEESEIDLDFVGFGGGVGGLVPTPSGGGQSAQAESISEAQHSSASPSSRSKDAGKTCKERTNYASFDCAATVLKSNSECKSASSLLVENKDSYMLNTCSADNKFFIVELCNDILIDTIVLANYEFFSSGFRHFRLSVSDRYPVKMEKWRDLGTFEARNTREIQAFLVENPLIWARYLRVELLTHYGSEYYCPVSLLRVHGTTMLEEFRHQEEVARGEDEETVLEVEASTVTRLVSEALPPVASSDGQTLEVLGGTKETHVASDIPVSSPVSPSSDTMDSNSTKTVNTTMLIPTITTSPNAVGIYEPVNLEMTCESGSATNSSGLATSVNATVATGYSTSPTTITNSSSTAANVTGVPQSRTPSALSLANTTSVLSPSADVHQDGNLTMGNLPSTCTATINGTANSMTVTTNSTMTNSSDIKSTASSNGTRSASSSSTTMSQAPPQPTTQESFFKSVHKRLQQLESNSTLSLQYIEEQSRILRDAFSKVEKRQISTTASFLSTLNQTVLNELHGFRQAYDQLWQSTVIELDGQRSQYQREMFALSSRLALMADELLWQKRMGIVQSTLLLLCLALVLFGRSGSGYLEVPSMQQMVNKSSAALRASWDSPPNSASPESRSPVSLFRRKLWRSSTGPVSRPLSLAASEAEVVKDGPDLLLQPPTPATDDPLSDEEMDAMEQWSPSEAGSE